MLSKLVLSLALMGFSTALVDDANNPTSTFQCQLPEEVKEEIQSYKDVANKIIKAVLEGDFKGTTYSDLATFVDGFGNRIAGSEALEKAIDYAVDKMKTLKFDKVSTEDVISPKWVRGTDEVTMLKPWKKRISALGLAMSESTPPEGITGEIVVVKDFDDLTKNVKNATGKIVVFNAPFDDPENAIKYRQKGAIAAGKLGASAVLVRSYATFSLSTPHTGLMFYESGYPKIPAAEISIEDSELLNRLQQKGMNPVIHLNIQSTLEGNITTRNSIGDYIGASRPEEFVLISGHIDSYDVGQGALDDGYGVVISMKAVEVLKALKLQPKRTIRTILWTAEEIGEVPFGAEQYLKQHEEELKNNYSVFLEADSGIHNAHGLIFNGTKEANCIAQEVLNLLAPINATKLYTHFPRLKTDIVPLMQATGVPGALIATDADRYFWAHHSAADTMTFLNADDLDICLARRRKLKIVAASGCHINLPGVVAYLADVRQLLDIYTTSDGEVRCMMTESVVPDDSVGDYYGTDDKPVAHLPFNFHLLEVTPSSNASEILELVNVWYRIMPEGKCANFLLGNHDQKRAPTRWTEGAVDGANMINLLVPGTPVTCYGEELGMTDTFLTWEETVDPAACNTDPERYELFSRDPARAPMQWNNSTGAGFSTTNATWLPLNPNYPTLNVQAQLAADESNLKVCKELVKLRNTTAWKYGSYESLSLNNDRVLAFTRIPSAEMSDIGFAVIFNLSNDTLAVDATTLSGVPSSARVLVRSVGFQAQTVVVGQPVTTTAIPLGPKNSLVIEFQPNSTTGRKE